MTKPTGPGPLFPSSAPRNRVVLLVLAAVAVATLLLSIIAVNVAMSGGNNSDPARSDASSGGVAQSPIPVSEPTVVALQAPSGEATGRCRAPSSEALARQSVAFEGTVVELTDELATLEVAHWYVGGEAARVTVSAPDATLAMLLAGVDFAVGERYLVSAQGSQVTLCGLSAPWSQELERLYVEAFPA